MAVKKIKPLRPDTAVVTPVAKPSIQPWTNPDTKKKLTKPEDQPKPRAEVTTPPTTTKDITVSPDFSPDVTDPYYQRQHQVLYMEWMDGNTEMRSYVEHGRAISRDDRNMVLIRDVGSNPATRQVAVSLTTDPQLLQSTTGAGPALVADGDWLRAMRMAGYACAVLGHYLTQGDQLVSGTGTLTVRDPAALTWWGGSAKPGALDLLLMLCAMAAQSEQGSASLLTSQLTLGFAFRTRLAAVILAKKSYVDALLQTNNLSWNAFTGPLAAGARDAPSDPRFRFIEMMLFPQFGDPITRTCLGDVMSHILDPVGGWYCSRQLDFIMDEVPAGGDIITEVKRVQKTLTRGQFVEKYGYRMNRLSGSSVDIFKDFRAAGLHFLMAASMPYTMAMGPDTLTDLHAADVAYKDGIRASGTAHQELRSLSAKQSNLSKTGPTGPFVTRTGSVWGRPHRFAHLYPDLLDKAFKRVAIDNLHPDSRTAHNMYLRGLDSDIHIVMFDTSAGKASSQLSITF